MAHLGLDKSLFQENMDSLTLSFKPLKPDDVNTTLIAICYSR